MTFGGASSLDLTELLSIFIYLKQWPDWQKEYIEGGQLEIYMVQLPESFSGLRFDKVSVLRILPWLFFQAAPSFLLRVACALTF